MPASLATLSAMTKELYEGTLNKQLNDEVKTLKRIERTSEGVGEDVGGKYVVFPIHTRRNSGIGARNELELLPTPGQQGTAAGRVGLKYLYGGIELSGQSMKLAKTKPQAFISALDLEMQGLKRDLRKDLNRQVYSDGTGLVAASSAIATANTIAVSWAGWLQLGMQVDVITAGTMGNPTPTVKASNRQVTAVVPGQPGSVTIDGAAVAFVVGDILVRTGSVKREWTGLQAIVSNTGTLYNIDPTVEGVWKSEVDSNSGTNRALSEGLMINMVDRVSAHGGNTTVIFQSPGVRRAYFNLLTQQRRFTNTQKFEGGFSGLAFTTDEGEVPVVQDIDCPPNTQYFLNEKEIKVYRESDWAFMDEDGSIWNRKEGYDAYNARMFQYSELGTHRRNTHGVIKDVTEG